MLFADSYWCCCFSLVLMSVLCLYKTCVYHFNFFVTAVCQFSINEHYYCANEKCFRGCTRTCLSMACRSVVVAKSRTMCLSTADSRASICRNSTWHLPTSGTRRPSIWSLTPSLFSAECICSMFAKPAAKKHHYRALDVLLKTFNLLNF